MKGITVKIIDRKFLNVSTLTCHASTMAFYQNEPVFAWFGGIREGASDSSIYIQCHEKVFKMDHADQVPRWNPILFSYQDHLFLFVKIGIFCDRWQTLIYDISDIFDEKFNVSKIPYQILPAGLNGPVKTKPIADNNGIIYCGSSVETILDWTAYIESYKFKKGQFVFHDRSRPLTVPKITYNDLYYGKRQTNGIIQPSLWFDSRGVIHAFFRSSTGLGRIYYSFKDHKTWTNPEATDFENPNSGVDTVYTSKKLYLVYNPSELHRYPLVIKQLNDNFKTVDEITVTDLEELEKQKKLYSKELSYPYIIENDNKLYLTYTYGRSKCEYVVVSMD